MLIERHLAATMIIFTVWYYFNNKLLLWVTWLLFTTNDELITKNGTVKCLNCNSDQRLIDWLHLYFDAITSSSWTEILLRMLLSVKRFLGRLLWMHITHNKEIFPDYSLDWSTAGWVLWIRLFTSRLLMFVELLLLLRSLCSSYSGRLKCECMFL